MAIRDFTDLVCWQRSRELKCEVLDILANPACLRDFTFRDHIRDSSASAPSNIAEVFGHTQPDEFARFLGYAIASLNERAITSSTRGIAATSPNRSTHG